MIPAGADAALVPVACENPQTCGTCEFVATVNNVMQFTVGLLILIAVAVFVYAGFLYVTSAGNSSQIQTAHGLFGNVVIGIIIALAAYLIVNTVVQGLAKSGAGGLSWTQIECVYPTAVASLSSYEIENEYGSGPLGLGGGANPQYGGSGIGYLAACKISGSGPCSVEALRNAGFGDLAEDAARIVGLESGCGATARSGTDTTSNGESYSIGLWQINLAAHSLSCNGETLNCPAAFKDAGYRNKYNVRVKEIINRDLYDKCVTMASIPECNSAKAAELARNSGDMGDWACSAKRCGVQTSRNHLCPL